VAKQEGSLTPVQLEIMEVIWASEPEGATVADIWRKIHAARPVARTTILNLVDRLHKRGWLRRRKADSGFRYSATEDRSRTRARLAGRFVESFFEGSASNLVMSLLGGNGLDADDIERLRRILDESQATDPPGKGGRP
jgi:BlaI family transcriptional regulator, penicillinase repressor